MLFSICHYERLLRSNPQYYEEFASGDALTSLMLGSAQKPPSQRQGSFTVSLSSTWLLLLSLHQAQDGCCRR